ncbi:MAG TPA: hypothetical protein VJU61_28870, partial [Polyangiaceae bacterium]|nr:hypothetical protein [Polyangiaceae bacterium]
MQTDDLNRLEGMIRRFAPVDLTADVSSLPKNERDALLLLVNAGKILDALFLRQVWEENESLMVELAQDMSPLGQARL